MTEMTYKGNSTEKDEEAFTPPKNIRQIGEGGRNKKIYLEDYAVTYMTQLARKSGTSRGADSITGDMDGCRKNRGALLLGEKEQKENVWYFFINSVLELEDIHLEDEDWKEIQQEASIYFCGREILGWFLSIEDENAIDEDEISRIHLNRFGKNDKILIIQGQEEEEMEIYLTEAGTLARQSGYYIYYEKNEQMQDYMVSKNEGHSVEKETLVTDKAIQNFRKLAEEKKESAPSPGFNKFLYGACTFLLMTVLVMGVTTINNYDKMKNLEVALESLKGGDTQQAAGNSGGNGEKAVTANAKGSDAGKEGIDVKEAGDAAKGQAGQNQAEADGKQAAQGQAGNGGKTAVQDQTGTDSKATGQNQAGTDSKTTGQSPEGTDSNTAGQGQAGTDSKTAGQSQTGADGKTASQGQAGTDSNAANQSQTGSDSKALGQDQTDDGNKADGQSADAKSGTGQTGEGSAVPVMAGVSQDPANANRASYTVKAGDTLADICKMYYGGLDKLEELCSINGIEDENKILPGQKLFLP